MTILVEWDSEKKIYKASSGEYFTYGFEIDSTVGNLIATYASEFNITLKIKKRPGSGPRKAAKLGSRNKTGVQHVSFHKDTGKYQVVKLINGKLTHLGLVETIEEGKELLQAAEKYQL